jgi:serine/threonine protein kinase
VFFTFNRDNGIWYEAKVLQKLFLQLIVPLISMREQGIVQGDIKPDNILLNSATHPTRAVLCDFGAAKHLPQNFVSVRIR